MYHRSHRARRKAAAAFLVGPRDDFDRAACGHASFIHRFERFETGKHAVNAVEAPAAQLRVHVAASHDGAALASVPARRTKRLPMPSANRELALRRLTAQLARGDILLRQRRAD